MGGNALKNCTTTRLNAPEYNALVARVINDIQEELKSSEYTRRVRAITAYATKEDFGDADILIDSFSLPGDWIDRLAARWNSKEVVPNGDVVSFEVDEFQVDVIKAKPVEYEFAYSYFAYNDLGNLVGRMAKKFGLKYGHDGLWYTFRDGDQVIENILVSYDPEAIYDFLGLNKKWVAAGFNTLEEIFQFVSSSPYFNPDIYLFDNLNHAARVRDKKRKTYNLFLEWCKEYDGLVYEFDSDKTTYLPMLFDFFDKEMFKLKWTAALMKMFVARHKREKFNGEIVGHLTKLSGKDLGMFMSWLKDKFTEEQIITLSKPKIESMVLLLHDEFKNDASQHK